MKLVLPSKASGSIIAPPSKSHSQRLLLNSLISNEEITIKNLSYCDDSKIIINFLEAVGKKVKQEPTQISIHGEWESPNDSIKLGESGFAARVLPIILLSKAGEATFTGNSQLFKRPLDYLSVIAEKLGAHIEINTSLCKIIKKGIAKNLSLEYGDNISSQYLTGVLYLFALNKNYQEIDIKLLKSKGYIDLSINTLKYFGIEFTNESNYIKLNRAELDTNEFNVEGDWSAAAFYAVLGTLADGIEVSDLTLDTCQPDRAIYNLLKDIGAKITQKDNCFIFSKSNLLPFDYDASESPDLVPVIVPLAAKINGKSTILGIERLKYKESNRIKALVEGYKNLGVDITQNKNILTINGGKIIGGIVDSHRDHRLAMSFSIAGALSENGVYINDYECVKKSYPNFFNDIQTLNIKLHE